MIFWQQLLHMQDNIDFLLFALQIAEELHHHCMFSLCLANWSMALDVHPEITPRCTNCSFLFRFGNKQTWIFNTHGRLEIGRCRLFSLCRAMEPPRPWWLHGLRTLFCGRRLLPTNLASCRTPMARPWNVMPFCFTTHFIACGTPMGRPWIVIEFCLNLQSVFHPIKGFKNGAQCLHARRESNMSYLKKNKALTLRH